MEIRFREKHEGDEKRETELYLSLDKWRTFADRLERKEKVRQEKEKMVEYKKYLKEGSLAMTSQWDNSVEKIRAQKEEGREVKKYEKAQERYQTYLNIVNHQAKERDKYNKKIKEQFCQTRGEAKALNSAVWLSKVLRENEELLKVKKENQQYQIDIAKKHDQKVIDDDVEWNQNQIKEKFKNRRKAEELKSFWDHQVQKKRENNEAERKINIKEEMEDIRKMQDELNNIKGKEKQASLERKNSAKNNLIAALDYADFERLDEQKTDKEIASVCSTFWETKHKIKCTYKKRRDADIEKKRAHQEQQVKILDELINAKKIEENKRTEQNIKEKLKRFDKEQEKRKFNKIRLREERIKHQILEKEEYEQKLLEGEALKKWELANRFIQTEIIKKDEIIKTKEAQLKKENFAKNLKEQKDEKLQRMQMEKENLRKEFTLGQQRIAEKDKIFLSYGKECLKNIEETNGNTSGVKKVIFDYKKKFNLPVEKPKEICERVYDGQPYVKNNTIRSRATGKRVWPAKFQSVKIEQIFQYGTN